MTVSLSTGIPSQTVVTSKGSTRSTAIMALTFGRHKSTVTCKKPLKSDVNTVVDNANVVATRNATKNVNSISNATKTSITSNSILPEKAIAKNLNDVFPDGSGNSSGSENDAAYTVNSSTTTALRRLHFKSGRKKNVENSVTIAASNNPHNLAKFTHAHSVSDSLPASKSGVPKLIIMGSSSASLPDGNINTSTDSASTLITNVTHTDNSETCDSLDLGEASCQSDAILSSLEEPLLTAIQIDSDHDVEADLELMSCSRYSRPLMNVQDSTESQESCLSILTGEHSATKPLLSSSRCHNLARNLSSDIEKSDPIPNTAPPPISNANHFSFDLPKLPKSASTSEKYHKHFTFKESAPINHDQTNHSPKRERIRSPTFNRTINLANRNFTESSTKTTNFYTSNRGALKQKPYTQIAQHRKYSSSSSSGGSERENPHRDPTMFPFDREAIDLKRVQNDCLIVHETSSSITASSDSDDADHRSFKERKRLTTYGGANSPNNVDIFQQYKLLSQNEQIHQQKPFHDITGRVPSRKNSKRIRPDSVIHSTIEENQQYVRNSDAFNPQPMSSSSSGDQSLIGLNKFDDIVLKFEKIPSKQSLNTPANSKNPNISQTDNMLLRKRSSRNKSGIVDPTNVPQLDLQNCETDASSNCGGAINLTSNPMDTAVCTPPRATIVVQQPSLSLDNTVETLLIKNEGDFISVEQGNASDTRLSNAHEHANLLNSHHQQKQRCDENMRHLLDVSNTLTLEELRDFEMRYGSPHHNRSQSVKTPGSRASGRPNQLSLPQQRSRVASMPNTGVEEEYYRLRHFSITGKGVINRGDSLKSRRSRSNNSVASSNSSTEHLTTTQIPAPSSARTSATCSLASSRESSTSNPGNGSYKVLMLGGPAVGKSSLVSQFMTSEYLHAYDTSIDDDSGEKSVSVLLSGEESELIFIDHPYTEMRPDDCLNSYDPHGYCVIYSSCDRNSFNIAENVLQVLWTNQNIAQKAVILVGNKADLARCRLVTSEEGKAMATAYDCKFIETSVGINHNVDELLVGLLSQIRLKLENPEKSRDLFRKRSTRRSKRRACSPLGGVCLNPNTPIGPQNNLIGNVNSTPGSTQSSPRKYRGSRTSTSLKVKGLLGRVWARDSKSKSCENLHVL